VRPNVLQMISSPELTLIEHWPLANFDHEDRIFCFHSMSRQSFVCAKFLRADDSSAGAFSFSGWICAFDTELEKSLFSILESSLGHDEKMSQVLNLLSKADYRTE